MKLANRAKQYHHTLTHVKALKRNIFFARLDNYVEIRLISGMGYKKFIRTYFYFILFYFRINGKICLFYIIKNTILQSKGKKKI